MVQREVTCRKWEATLSKNQGNTRMLNKNTVQKAQITPEKAEKKGGAKNKGRKRVKYSKVLI